jgi:CheY-like chemotaxis protein
MVFETNVMAATQSRSSNSKTVLIVEGDVLTRHALAEYLRGCGFGVVETATGLEAKTVMQRGPQIDVVLADARVADGESGFALAQWTRRYRPQVSIALPARSPTSRRLSPPSAASITHRRRLPPFFATASRPCAPGLHAAQPLPAGPDPAPRDRQRANP